MNAELVWPILCLIAGLALLVAEVFIPSGGLLGLLAAGLLIWSLWLAFAIDTPTGLKFLAALVILVPAAIAGAIHVWPRTPMAKWIFLPPPEPADLYAADDPSVRLEHLIGQFGRTLTPLRPSGAVDFEGRRVDGLSEEGLIPSGSLVRAVQVRGGQLVVRQASEHGLEDLLG